MNINENKLIKFDIKPNKNSKIYINKKYNKNNKKNEKNIIKDISSMLNIPYNNNNKMNNNIKSDLNFNNLQVNYDGFCDEYEIEEPDTCYYSDIQKFCNECKNFSNSKVV